MLTANRVAFSRVTFICAFAILTIILGALIFTRMPLVAYANNTAYYVNNQSGSNCSNAGPGTSLSAPWCDFTNVNSTTFLPGDQILLARGATWDQVLQLHGSGTSSSWITLDAYGTGNKPKIQRSSNANDRTMYMYDPSYWSVKNLEIANAGEGIYVYYTTLGHDSLYFDNLYIHNIDNVVDASPSTTDGIYYSTGIMIDGNGAPYPSTSQWVLRNIKITNSEIAYTTSPITIIDQVLSSNEQSTNAFQNVRIKNNYIHHAKGPMALEDITDGKMISNQLDTLGTVYLPQGTTAVFQWKTENFTYVNNFMNNVPNTGSADQIVIDFEGYTNNSYIYSNYISNTAGSGIEFLQLGGGNPPRDPALDHNTNNYVAGNVFDSNSGYALKTVNSSSNPTGSLTDNLYYEPSSGFTTGSFVGFSISNNLSISSISNIYNAGKHFSSTLNSGGSACTTGSSCWSYQLYNGSSYSNLSYDATNQWWGFSTGNVSRFDELPNSTSSNWVARAWTAPAGGTISLRGRVLKNDIDGGDGIKARITKNGAVIWPAGGTPQTIAFNDSSGVNTNLDSVSVAAGDVIRFEVNNGGSANSSNDSTSWAPSIAYTAATCTPGLNLALCRTFSASSQWDSSQAAGFAFDGTTGTNWQAASGAAYNGTWLQVDFGASTTFNKVVLSEYTDNRTAGFRIEYWNGSAWSTAYTGTTIGTVASPSIITFAAVTGSKARIYYTSGIHTAIMYEFEIYNQAAGDTTAPAAVTNLAVSATTSNSASLSWTSPGDDGSTGTAASYDIRYSTSAITSANWASAAQAAGEPAPAVAGSNQSFTISGLNASTTYYFAMKTSDEVPNISGLSNVSSGTTSAASSNLALGKTYSATSQWDSTRTPDKAFDSDYSTVWQTAGGAVVNGSWLQVDFGTNITFDKVILSEYGSRTTGYRIEYWNGTAWSTAYTGTSMGSPTSPSTHTFTAVTGSKARIYFTSGIDIPLIYEFEIYNQGSSANYSIGAAATASNTDTGNGYAPGKINDGSATTDWSGWANTGGAPDWVQLDFGANKTFSRVELYTTTGYEIKNYQIQYWNGTSWVDAIAITGNTLNHRTSTFTAVTSSKIRVYGTAGPDIQSGYVRVNELEVYSN